MKVTAPPEAVEALASLAWKGLLKCASDRQRSVVRQLVRARIAQESLDQLEQRRSLGWASSHDPAPILIGQHRQVLHGLHVSPTHQRLLRERNADLFSRARSGLEQTATIVCQLPRASHRVRAEGQARDKSQTDHRQSASHFLKHAGCRGPRVAASGDASALWMEFPASTRRSQGALRVSRQRPSAWTHGWSSGSILPRFAIFRNFALGVNTPTVPGGFEAGSRHRFGKNTAATGRRWVVSSYCPGQPGVLPSEPTRLTVNACASECCRSAPIRWAALRVPARTPACPATRDLPV
jgi:hypothetical protein